MNSDSSNSNRPKSNRRNSKDNHNLNPKLNRSNTSHHPSTPSASALSLITKWTVSSRIFHWGGALLMFITWSMIVIHENSEGHTFIALHKAFGVSLLCWTIVRLINKCIQPAPAPLPMPTWQKALAHLTHFLLYILLLAMPIAGILMSWYGGHTIDMFGLFQIPVMLEPNRARARFFNNLHTDIIWPAILVLTALHIVAAIYHQFIVKDSILLRMK